MTVEQLIDLLLREHLQALVLVESTGPDPSISASPLDAYSVLEPYAVRSEARRARVYIVCEHHDC